MKRLLLAALFCLPTMFSYAQWNDPDFVEPLRKTIEEQLDTRFIMDTVTKKIFVDCYINTLAGLFKKPQDALSVGQDSLQILEGKILRSCIYTEADRIKTFFMKWEYIEMLSSTYIVSLAKQFVPDLKQLNPEIQKWMVERTFALYKLYYPLGMPLKIPEFVSQKLQDELIREAKGKGYLK